MYPGGDGGQRLDTSADPVVLDVSDDACGGDIMHCFQVSSTFVCQPAVLEVSVCELYSLRSSVSVACRSLQCSLVALVCFLGLDNALRDRSLFSKHVRMTMSSFSQSDSVALSSSPKNGPAVRSFPSGSDLGSLSFVPGAKSPKFGTLLVGSNLSCFSPSRQCLASSFLSF